MTIDHTVTAHGAGQPPTPVYHPTTVVNVHATPAPAVLINQGHGMLVRIVWYLCIGWWLSGLVMFAAGVFIVTIVGIPLGLALVNRLPGVLTLRPATQRLTATVAADGSMQYMLRGAQQRPMWQRSLYFIFIGCWASLLYMIIAWFLSVVVIGLPLALMILNRLPTVTTLRRN